VELARTCGPPVKEGGYSSGRNPKSGTSMTLDHRPGRKSKTEGLENNPTSIPEKPAATIENRNESLKQNSPDEMCEEKQTYLKNATLPKQGSHLRKASREKVP